MLNTLATGLDGSKVYVRLSVTINIFLSFTSLTKICMFNIYKSLFQTGPYRTWASALNWLNFMVFKLQRYTLQAHTPGPSQTASAVSLEHSHEKKIQAISHLASVLLLQLSRPLSFRTNIVAKPGGSRSTAAQESGCGGRFTFRTVSAFGAAQRSGMLLSSALELRPE